VGARAERGHGKSRLLLVRTQKTVNGFNCSPSKTIAFGLLAIKLNRERQICSAHFTKNLESIIEFEGYQSVQNAGTHVVQSHLFQAFQLP
jgi:hypothetical protein